MPETTVDIADVPQGQSVYHRLLDEIRHGELPPGSRLTEVELAARLETSRTPVREAIRQLEADGLVTHVPRQGATVRTLDYSEVMELYEMRAVLEGTAARLAARGASEIEIAELDAINREMAGAIDDPARIRDLNRVFHLTLLDAAKNRFLMKATNALQKTLLILGPSTLGDAERAKTSVREHDRILTAIKSRAAGSAETAMRSHIDGAHSVRLRQLRDRTRSQDGT